MNEIDKLFNTLIKTEEVLAKTKKKQSIDNKVVPISTKNQKHKSKN